MGDLEKMALVSDALEDLFPDSEIGVYVLLNKEEFRDKVSKLSDIKEDTDKYSINISGIDFIFILNPDGS